MNAHPDGLRGKASLRIANAKALTINMTLCTSENRTHPMSGNT